jgi:hypothetical protein
MIKRLDRTRTLDPANWASLTSSFGEQLAVRWVDAWRYYYGDWFQLLARAPLTRWMIAEFIALSYGTTFDFVELPSQPSSALRFEVDDEAEAAGPEFIALPADLNGLVGTGSIDAIGKTPICPGGGSSACPGGTKLDNENVRVRAEGGFLSVTLVGLRPIGTNKARPTGAGVTTAYPGGGLTGSYHLHVTGSAQAIPFDVKHGLLGS